MPPNRIPITSASQFPSAAPGGSFSREAVQVSLGFELRRRFGADFLITLSVSLDVGGWEMIPALAIFPPTKLDLTADELIVKRMPLTAIEVLSFGQPLDELLDNADAHLRVGVKSCWVAVPRLRGVFVSSAPGQQEFFHHYQTLTDPATGIELPLGPVFK